MARTIRKIAQGLLFRSQGNSKPYLEPDFLKLLNALIEWRVSIEFARREAEEKAIWAEAFADGTAMQTATLNEPLHPNQLT